MARTLLGVLGHATLNFVAVATLLFCFFCECPKFCDLAKQQRKMFLGFSEVGKIDFALYFCWLCVFFVIFYILLLRSRDDRSAERKIVKNSIVVPVAIFSLYERKTDCGFYRVT